jgi:poly(A) polymerase
MEINLSKAESAILQLVSEKADSMNAACFAIGGFVRDKFLNRPSKDIDIVIEGDGVALAKAVADACNPKVHVNYFETYGTAQIKINDIEVEFVGARKESYTPESRNPIVEPGSIQDDQLRRDFTINALAICLNKEKFGELVDPFHGLEDLEDKLIITPIDEDKTFSDDPLRMLRAIRFASQLGFSIANQTFEGIAKNAHRISIITQERITTELNKIVLSPMPSIGFELLDKTGLLPLIFPAMSDLKGVEKIGKLAHKDNFYHTIQVLDNVARTTNDLWIRWAAILHDIAKPATKAFEPGHGFTFHNHEHVGAKMVPRIFTKLKLPLGAEMRFVQKLVLLHLRPISLHRDEITDSAIRRLLFDAGDDIDALMMLCNADITSKNDEKVARIKNNFALVKQRMIEVEERDHIRNFQPVFTGEDIMEMFNLQPSKQVGDLKNALRDAILDGEIQNTIEEAVEFLKKQIKF